MNSRWTIGFVLMSIENAIDRLRLLQIGSSDVEILEIDRVGLLYRDQTTALIDRMKISDEGDVCEIQRGRACVLMVLQSIDLPDDVAAVMIAPVCRLEFRHEADHRAFMGKVTG